jgi:DNA-binding transcriptional MerR regulator
VADYYTPAQLALKVGISEAQIAELESKGFLHPKLKDGRRFFSSHQGDTSCGWLSDWHANRN